MSLTKLKTKFANGAWITNVKEYFTKTNEIIDAMNNSGVGSYKVYTALLTQSGESAPVATVLENTLGEVTITRDDIGSYHLISNGLFLEGKTFGFIGSSINAEGINIFYQRATDSDFYFNTQYLDEMLNQTSIEIRVYN